ncbi:hypothetical protein Rhe02_98380 [Rhizocola hellebori]|uniref:Uncharacterized protein n=2 Tax=Rhizocola hellebori TaxID=1392758 RepID=A0A8J3VMV8_9ACTN|nr:hypothetical protein Rhe02_98380 [Rhizocola hellebori]
MSLLFTKTDCVVWQRKAAAALHEMMDAAVDQQLPLVTWQLGVAGTLMGRCIGADMNARYDAFVRWTSFLGIAGWNHWEANGTTHLYGITQGFRGCQVSMAADLLDFRPGDLP